MPSDINLGRLPVRLLDEAAELCGVAEAKGTLRSASAIVNLTLETHEISREYERLIGCVCEVALIVSESFEDGSPHLSQEVLNALRSLESELETILEFLQGLPRRRVQPVSQIKSRLEQLRSELLRSLDSFKISMALRTEKMLVDLTTKRQEAFIRWVATLRERSQIAISDIVTPSPGSFSRGRLPPGPALFGRDKQLDDLVTRVIGGLQARPSVRLSLLGTGGVGKSSLALAILHDARIVQKFCARRIWLPCDGATNADAVTGALAAYLSVSGKSSLRKVAECLGTAPTILVLDNFETPWEPENARLGSEQLLASLAEIESLTLIVTMRGAEQPAGVAWTQPAFPTLQPFDLPAASQTFFSIAPNLPDDQLADVQKLLQLVDCLPLAVRLLAVLAQVDAPASLLKRWQLESTGMLDRGDDKNSSLDVSLRISLSSPRLAYPPGCLSCLAVISLFPDGLSEVEGVEIFYGHIPAVRKCVVALKRAALVYSEMGRLRVLAPIRAYVLTNHPPSEAHLAPLVDYCLRMAVACSQMVDADPGGAISAMTSEIGNLQAVLLHLVSRTSLAPEVLPALVNLDWCLLYMGLRTSNIELLREGLRCAQRIGDRGHELDLQTRLGRYAEHDEKLILLGVAIDTARELGDPIREADAEYLLSTSWTRQGQLDLAHGCAERALNLYLSKPDSPASRRGQQECYASLANNEYHAGEYRKARDYISRALALREGAGRAANALQLRCTMAVLTFMLGEYAAAETEMTRVLALAREAHDGHAAYLALNGLAGISSIRGDNLLALSQIREAGVWCKRLGLEDNAAWCERYAAFIHLEREEYEEAQALLYSALPVFKRLGNTWGEGNTELALALLSNGLGDHDACAAHFDRVNAIARANKFTELQAEAIMEMGNITLAAGDACRALLNFAAAFVYYRKLNTLGRKVDVLVALGDAFSQLSDADTALACFRLALMPARKYGMKRIMGGSLVGVGKLWARGGTISLALRARAAFLEAATAYREVKDEVGLRKCMEGATSCGVDIV